MDGSLRVLIDGEFLTRCEIQEYLRQLVWRIIVEMYRLSETALQTRVGVDEVMHLVCIASHDTDELSTIILQTFQKGVNSLCTKRITIVGLQGISLIDKQHATDSLIHQLIGLDGCLSGITCHQLSTGDNTKRLEDIRHDTGHRCLTSTGITRKHIVLALESIGLSTLDLQVKEGSKVGNLLLDSRQTDKSVESFEAFLIIDCLRSLIRYILIFNRHQLLIAH